LKVLFLTAFAISIIVVFKFSVIVLLFQVFQKKVMINISVDRYTIIVIASSFFAATSVFFEFATDSSKYLVGRGSDEIRNGI
jgi:hypothetical protein